MIAQISRIPFSLWLSAGVIYAAACRPPRAPEPAELAEARVLVATARITLPLARATCPLVADRMPYCEGTLDALADALAVAEPLLASCPAGAPEPEHSECESNRLEEIRARLPELRRLAAVVAGLARGEAPAPAASGAP